MIKIQNWLLKTSLVLAALVVFQPPLAAQDDDDRPMIGGPAGKLPLMPGLGPGGSMPRPTLKPTASRSDEDGPGGGDDAKPSGGDDKPSGPTPRSSSSRSSSSSSSSSTPSAPPRPANQSRPPKLAPNSKVTLDFVNTPLQDLVKFMAEITGRNFILTDDLKGEITIISHQMVSPAEAYEAFLSALAVKGYTTVTVGKITKVVKDREAASHPLRVYEGGTIPYIDNFVTQIFQFENTAVSDISSVVKQLSGSAANIIAYQPTNTLIVTDSAVNIRRMWKVVSQLDVAAPRSTLQVVPVRYAMAAEIARLITDLYGVAGEGASSTSSSRKSNSAKDRKRRRRADKDAAGSATTTSVGEGRYISKILADERTNSLIIQANETAMADILSLIGELDVDVDPSSRSQIHVVYLEHAKAQDVAQVLTNLSQESQSRGSSRSNSRRQPQSRNQNSRSSSRGRPERDQGTAADSASPTAVFEDGVKVTADENTNSLVIVASPESFAILRQVIDKLDIRRKQVFVEAVIMEIASDDDLNLGLGMHMGLPGDSGSAFSFGSAQLNGNSVGLDLQSVLSGMAMGVFGDSIEVTLSDGTTVPIPAFGVALNALQANSMVNILSTPNILTLDNEEAKIVVGRNIPFPISSGLDSNGNQLISYQREDVAITLKVTPQINESDFVTLEIFQEVSEIEEDSSGLDVNSAGFITSKRSAETTVLVKDNQTVVIGGLMGQTETEVETKIPLLGDLPLVGALFRGRRKSARKTNLLIVMTPHVIDEPEDLEEVYRIKVAQREEFLRRFYGKTTQEQAAELNGLLRYSMNVVNEPSVYRTQIQEPEPESAPEEESTGEEGPSGESAAPVSPEDSESAAYQEETVPSENVTAALTDEDIRMLLGGGLESAYLQGEKEAGR